MNEYKMRITHVAMALLVDGKLDLENFRPKIFGRGSKAEVVIDSITIDPIPSGFHVAYRQKGKPVFEIDTHHLNDNSTLTLTGFKAFVDIELSDS